MILERNDKVGLMLFTRHRTQEKNAFVSEATHPIVATEGSNGDVRVESATREPSKEESSITNLNAIEQGLSCGFPSHYLLLPTCILP